MFRTKTVDRIVAGFAEMVTDLIEVRDRETRIAAVKRDEVEDLLRQISSHEGEAERAAAVAEKIQSLTAGS